MKQLLLITGILSVLCFSCDEADVLAEFNTTDFWETHHSQSWDSTSTANELLGTWVWEYNVCCPLGVTFEGSNKSSENVKVIFSVSEIKMIIEDEVTTTTNWGVTEIDDNLFALNMDNPIPILHGRILFADNRVLFNASYIDSADNYFYKDLSDN